MFTFKINYFLLAVLLFIIEAVIALFVHDAIVRPYIGDVLVVILVYCFVKSFIRLPDLLLALLVLCFAFTVEFLQYLNFIAFLGLENSRLARIVLGTSFQWVDLLAYTLGILIVILLERSFEKKKQSFHL